jgi:predicted nucleic acid-binding protein
MSDAVFVDTWGWVALGHRNDSRHEEVKRFYLQLRDDERRIYTSDFVLDEVITLLFRRESFDEAVQLMEGIFAASELEHLVVEKVTSARFEEAWKLRLRFDDKPSISFTDLTTIVLMKELDLSEVLTDDDHFIHVGMGFQKVPQL